MTTKPHPQSILLRLSDVSDANVSTGHRSAYVTTTLPAIVQGLRNLECQSDPFNEFQGPDALFTRLLAGIVSTTEYDAMTPERIAEIRAMPHDNWRIVHELLEALDAANAELSRLRSSPAREREIVELSKQVATIARERDEAQGVDAAYLNDASLRATRMKVRFGEAALLPLPQRIRCIALAVKEFATSGWERVAVADIAAEIGDCAHDVQRMSVPQGVEVPELTGEECEQILRSFPASLPAWEDGNWALAFAKVVEFVRARLVPTPPQAATVPVVLNPPKQDKDCGDCTRLVICNGELACLCGPTGKMFDRKPDAPQSDAVVVPKDLLERLHDFVAAPPNMVARMQLQGEIGDALRTSAQDETRG